MIETVEQTDRMASQFKAVFGVSAMLLLIGCGEQTGSVTGKVTYQGEPVTLGSISLHMPSKGIAQDAALNRAGEFSMESPLPVGTYRVYYVPPQAEPPQDPNKKTLPGKVQKIIVPKKYHGLEGSDMSIEVKSGKNPIVVDFK